MAELFTVHWWHISLAVAVAVVTAVAHRACATIAFETSYRKGFFTQGTLFGAFFGFLGAFFVSTWRQSPAPNSTNQQQLEIAAADGPDRWNTGLAQLAIGLGILVYQLMTAVILRNPAIGSDLFWLVGPVLILTGWFLLPGAYPAFHMLPPVEGDDSDDPPELVKFVSQRYQWGLAQNRIRIAGQLAVVCFVLMIVAILGGVAIWGFGIPFNHWFASLGFLLIAVIAVVLIRFLNRRMIALEAKSFQLVLDSAPTPRHRRLLEMQNEFYNTVEGVTVVDKQKQTNIVPVIVVGLITLLIGLAVGLSTMAWAGFAVILISPIDYLVARRNQDTAEDAGNPYQEYEQKYEEIEALARELEAEDLARIQQSVKEELPQFYTFQMGEITGRSAQVPEEVRQMIKRSQLDEDLRELYDQDQAERRQGYMVWAYHESEYLWRLRNGRSRAFLACCIILLMMVVFDVTGFPPVVWSVLKFTALACFGLAAFSFLPEKILAMRDPGFLGCIGKLASVALVIIVLWALCLVPS